MNNYATKEDNVTKGNKKLTEEDKEEVIILLKQLTGVKRKLEKLIK